MKSSFMKRFIFPLKIISKVSGIGFLGLLLTKNQNMTLLILALILMLPSTIILYVINSDGSFNKRLAALLFLVVVGGVYWFSIAQ